MNRQDYVHLLGEHSALQRMIAETPEDEALDRGSLMARLEDVDYQLAQVQIDEREPVRARLTFNGRPVVGSHGIFAEFGAKAVNTFAEAVAAIAASLTAPLAAMGPIPNREQSQLLITNTAVGSFGFELEAHRLGELPFEEQTIVEQALERTRNLLQGMVNPDDELLADSAAELDQRALDKVRAFVNTLAENEAVCALQFRDTTFRFVDVAQIRTSLTRISRDNLREEERFLDGEFQGVLPKRRTFEFKLGERDEVVTGKIGPAISDPDELNMHLHQAIRIRVMMTRVGDGRPRYVLLEAPEWTPSQGALPAPSG